MTNPEALLPPGFRFHPTDEELILHYLMKQAASLPCPVSIIAEVDIYKFDPWDLPAMAMFGDREWYFFSPRDRKYPNGVRPNRAAASGYWKATGTDKPIVTSGPRKETVGVKKALVFYRGKPPKGIKTKWIMHEYRLVENNDANHSRTMKHRDSMRLDDWVLCRIYRKSGNPTISSSDHGNHDDINSEAAYPPAGHGAGTSQSDVRLPKSSSLSQLLLEDADFSVLSRLLYENPSDMVYPEPGSHLGEANPNHLSRLYGGGNGTDTFGCQPPMTQPTAAQPPLAAAGSHQMRQRPASDYADADVGSPFLQPRKYATAPFFSHANMSNPAPAGNSASVQCNNMLGERQTTFLHQQLLLNPHPGHQ